MSTVTAKAFTVGAMTGISRIGGCIREILMGWAFGASLEKSAFDVAFKLPNLFRRLFGEGALTGAFVPEFAAALKHHGEDDARRLAGRMATLVAAVLGLLVAGLILLTLALQPMLSPRWQVVLPLLRIMLPYALLICLAAFGVGMLNALHRFALPALSPLILNVVWITVLLVVSPFLPVDPAIRIRAVAWGIVAAGLLQLAAQLPQLRAAGMLPRLRLDWRRDGRVRKILLLMLPVALSSGLWQVNVCIDGVLALWAAEWAPATLEYAERLVYLPLGLVGTAFGSVLLATFSHQTAAGDSAGMRDTLQQSLRNQILIMAPAAAMLLVLAAPVVEMVYVWRGGRFDPVTVVRTAHALMAYAPGLMVFCVEKAMTPAFYALQDTRTPLRVSSCCIVLNFCLNLTFVLSLPGEYKHAGIASATVISSTVNGLTLAWLLGRRADVVRGAEIWPTALGAVAAAALMGAVLYHAHGWTVGALAPLPRKLALLGSLSAAGLVGTGIYLLAVWRFCPAASRELVAALRRRRRRSA